ncbi:MAG TPA: glycosyltransferase [Rhodanobacteraceae bacterium]|nr:glycosyltransferase [Rhodanobacteraceae bacterium]
MTELRRSRILLVTRNLPPLVGGMERLNWHMADELAKVAEVRIVGPQGAAAVAPAGIMVREAPLQPLWRFLLAATRLAWHEARRWRPDIVLAGSGLTAPLAWFAARACGASSAAYVHGLDIAVSHPLYRALWLPAIRRMDRVIANSRATAALCRDIGVDAARLAIVHPGVDLPDTPTSTPPRSRPWAAPTDPALAVAGAPHGREHTAPAPQPPESHPSPASAFVGAPHGRDSSTQTPTSPDPRASTAPADRADVTSVATFFRQRHQLGNRPVLLSVGRLSTRKGLREFVTRALPRIVAAQPETRLLIIGDAPTQALHAKAQTPAAIQAAADAAGVGANLLFLGKVRDAELEQAYCAADVHVFPIRAIPGDPEGFGMVAVEAAAHGVPTVAFACGGVVDAVADGQSGYLVPPDDYTAFADRVLLVLDAGPDLGSSSRDFSASFAWPRFGERIAQQLSVRQATL